MLKKVLCIALAGAMLCLCASCASKETKTSETAPVEETPPDAPEPSTDVNDAPQALLPGDWMYYVPGERGVPALRVSLGFDGAFSAEAGEKTYRGTWTVEPFGGGENAPADRLTLTLSAAADGNTLFGDFTVGLRTECGGEILMLWSVLSSGGVIGDICGTPSPVMRKSVNVTAGSPERRRGERFLAVCWKTDSDDTLLWLDDVADLTGAPEGTRSCTGYSLSPYADLRCEPSLLAPGGMLVQVETDGNGDIVFLNWVTGEQDLIEH